MKKQSDVIDAFIEGMVQSEHGEKPKHIITSISDLFVFNEMVYKIYKHDNAYFNASMNDLSDKKNRFMFTRDDFLWNQKLSPEIYRELRGIVLKDSGVAFVDPSDSADELCIVMHKMDTHNGLLVQLMDGRLIMSDLHNIGFQLGVCLQNMPTIEDNGVDLYEDITLRIRDVREYLGFSKYYIPDDEAHRYVEYLESFAEEHKADIKEMSNMIGTGLDVHSENMIYEEEKLFLIDTYPPTENWRRGHKHINIYRPATDVYALRGEKEFRGMLAGYQEASGEVLDDEYKTFFVVYSAAIMTTYLYVIGIHDPLRMTAAERYHTFLQEYFREQTS